MTYPKSAPDISHKLLRQSQFLETFMEILECPLYRKKWGPSPLLNVAAYWKSINSEACAKELSQILANNIDNGGRGIGLRIYVRYCRVIQICRIQCWISFCLDRKYPFWFILVQKFKKVSLRQNLVLFIICW